MARDMNPNAIHRRGFQMDLPVYVKSKPIQASGRIYKQGEEFPWREKGMKPERVANMFPRLLRHSRADLEARGIAPAEPARPHVVPEKTAEQLLNEKAPEAMTNRELRVVAKHVGAPTKRTRAEQLEAVLNAMGETDGVDV